MKYNARFRFRLMEVFAWGHATRQLGGDVGPRNDPFLTTFTYPFFPYLTPLYTPNICFPSLDPSIDIGTVNYCLILLILMIVVIRALYLELC